VPAERGPEGWVEAFERAAERRRQPLLVTAERTLRYGDVVDRARRVAGLCAARGWKPGDRVLVASEDPIETTALYLALARNGVTVAVVDPGASEREARVLLEIGAPVAIFADRAVLGRWRLPGGPEPVEITPPERASGALFRRLVRRAEPAPAAAAGWPRLLDAVSEADPPAALDPDGDAHVLFTSGTTSTPKGVRIGRRALFAHLRTLREVFGYDETTRTLNVLPLHHTDGLVHGPLVAFDAGAVVHRPAPFRIGGLPALLDAIYAERITHWITVPAVLAMVERLGADFEESFDGDDFRTVVSSAAPLPEALWRRFEERFGAPVANVYGLTETVVGGLFAGPGPEEPRIGTVGRPVDCEVRIVGEDGAPVARGEVGELEMRGEHLMSGYLGSDEQPIRDGWLRTGDRAREDESGAYRIVGRRKNLVITGGINVQPEEVTEVLASVPGVVEAVTFGMPDEILGERVVSCVALDPASGLRASDLAARCREALSPEKRPARIHVLDSLPRGPAGKVRLEAIRERIERESGAVAAEGTLRERIVALAAEVFQLDPRELGPGARAADTPGWDSLGHLELVTEAERVFGVEIATREVLAIETLADLEETLARKLG
jgi:long-chain acyl-CoA synthetase